MNEVKRLIYQGNIFREQTKMKMELPVNEHSSYRIVRSLEKQLKRSPRNNVKPNIVFTGTKLSSNFNVKDPYHLLKNMT